MWLREDRRRDRQSTAYRSNEEVHLRHLHSSPPRKGEEREGTPYPNRDKVPNKAPENTKTPTGEEEGGPSLRDLTFLAFFKHL